MCVFFLLFQDTNLVFAIEKICETDGYIKVKCQTRKEPARQGIYRAESRHVKPKPASRAKNNFKAKHETALVKINRQENHLFLQNELKARVSRTEMHHPPGPL